MADPLRARRPPTVAATGLMLMPPTSHLEVAMYPRPQPLHPEPDGVENLRQRSTRMLMENQVLVDHPELSQLEVLVTGHGEMASIPQVLPTLVSSVSSSA